MQMVQRIREFLVFAFTNFGPIAVFYGANYFWGLKVAIGVSVLFSILDVGRRIYFRQPVTTLFKFSAAITLIFGAVDLYSQQSLMFKFEAAITNLFTGIFFCYSIFGKKTVIQEYYETGKNLKPMTRDRVAYFRLLTGVWVMYFFCKAGAYLWIALHYSLEQGVLVRTVLGTGSFYAMLFASIIGSKKIFPMLKRLGVLPQAETG